MVARKSKPIKIDVAESLDLISSATQLSPKAIREEYNLKRVELRKLGIRLMKVIMAGLVGIDDELIAFIKDDLRISCTNGAVAFGATMNRMCFLLKKDSEVSGSNFYSSIHKAKGLEAECVLAVAKALNQLKKWIETEFEERRKDKQDICRTGFVGFIRAKQILCIACKAPLDDQARERLRNLGVSFI